MRRYGRLQLVKYLALDLGNERSAAGINARREELKEDAADDSVISPN